MYTFDMYVTVVSDAVMMSSPNLSHLIITILGVATYSVTYLN